ncbi:hypothetical protein [Aquicoccus porphyridii]|uniref:hypothetical protein n=1 Tax=Aquicoccus porphyridii TaxID=1852029 RepID=UPI00273FB335|nr:hypothetical protein [Aquicoccus porphyridii]
MAVSAIETVEGRALLLVAFAKTGIRLVDSGWIKALELPAKITGGLFAASVLILLVDGSDALNLHKLGSWAQPLVVVVVILSGCLFASSIIAEVWQATESYRLKRQSKAHHKKRVQEFIADIPYLTENEKVILGYLRHYKQKRFTGAHDAGHARTLLSRGYVRYIGVAGQAIDPRDVPFEVSSHVWEVVEARPDDFPHRPKYSDKTKRVEVFPWRERLF